MVIESAFDRIVRILTLAVGLGGLLFTLLAVPSILEQHAWLDLPFAIAVYALFLGVPPVLAALSFRLPVMTLRIALGAHAALALVFVALWRPALDPAVLPTDDLAWILNTIAVATCTAALALPFAPAIAYSAVAAVLCGILQYTISGDVSAAFLDVVLITLFSVVLATLLQIALRASREQDAALAVAQADAAASSSAETLEKHRVRFEQFARDEVLATFAAALRDGPETSAATRAEARAVLDRMTDFDNDHALAYAVSAREFEALLRAATRGAVALGFRADESVSIPVEVAETLADALGEAVTNSEQHAARPDGKPVLRRALAQVTPAGVEITVSDDGRGFSPSRIAPDRFGVRVTILQAVDALPGARAEVVSARGRGTTVTLRWSREGGR